MRFSNTEIDILLKIYSITININDEVFIGLLYNVTTKNYLWKSINLLINKKLLVSYMDGRKKYVSFTSDGWSVVKLLYDLEEFA